jgi:hypothetical protein
VPWSLLLPSSLLLLLPAGSPLSLLLLPTVLPLLLTPPALPVQLMLRVRPQMELLSLTALLPVLRRRPSSPLPLSARRAALSDAQYTAASYACRPWSSSFDSSAATAGVLHSKQSRLQLTVYSCYDSGSLLLAAAALTTCCTNTAEQVDSSSTMRHQALSTGTAN